MPSPSVCAPAVTDSGLEFRASETDIAGTRAALGNAGPVPYLRNPGFEEMSGIFPSYWGLLREAFLDSNAALANNGTNSVRSSRLFGWGQYVQLPCSAFQTFAVDGVTTREFDFERPATFAYFTDGNDQYLTSGSDDSPVTTGSRYGKFWTVIEAPEKAERASIFLGCHLAQVWLRFDDLRLFTEQFSTPDIPNGEPWQVSGPAEPVANGFSLGTGAAISQHVASGRDTRQYFLAFLHASAAGGTLEIRDEEIPRDANETTIGMEATISITAGTGFAVADLPRQPSPGSGRSRVALRILDGDNVVLTQISRGFAKVEPDVLTIGANSPDKGLQLTAAWPGKLASASIDILQHGIPVAPPLTAILHGTSVRAGWDGANLPSGEFEARFTLVSDGEDTVEVRRPFRIVNEAGPGTVPPFRRDEFTRGAWIFVRFALEDSEISRVFQLARRDGFDFAVAHCRIDQLDAVRRAAERTRMPFVIQATEVRNILGAYLGRDFFGTDDYLTRVRGILEPVLDSPFYRGVYVIDEPEGARQLDLNRRANFAIARQPTLGPAFAVLTAAATPADLQAIQPATAMVDLYPFRSNNKVSDTDALLAQIPLMNSYAHAMAGQGRDFWAVIEGFEAYEAETFRTVPNSLHTAQLGAAVLAGARGIVPFTYSSIGYIEGIRGPELEQNRKLRPYTEFNRTMQRLGRVFMQLPPPVLDARAPSPFAVSVAAHPDRGNFMIVLNADGLSPQTLQVKLSSKPARPLVDLVRGRRLYADSGVRFRITLSAGEWTMIPLGTLNIASMDTPVVKEVNLSSLDLPVTHRFTAKRIGGEAEPVVGLSFNDAGDAIAASVRDFWYEPAAPHVYRLGDDGSVDQFAGTPWYPHERFEFVGGGLIAATSVYFGARFYPENDLTLPIQKEFTGVTGGAYDVVPDNDRFWITMHGAGIRQLRDTPAGLRSEAVGLSESDLFLDLFGPFSDGSVASLVRNTGVNNIKPGILDEAGHKSLPLPRTQDNASLNATGILAVPRYQRGLSLVRIGNNGEPERIIAEVTDMVEATGAAWIAEDVLAVGDGVFNVRFYRYDGKGRPRLLGTWRPPVDGHMYIRALASKGERLAVGLQDGRVFVANTASIREGR